MKQLWVIGLAGAALVGCTPAEKADVNEQVRGLRQEVDQAAQNARQAAADTALAARVKTALANRKGVEADGIDVDAKGGVVTLKGDVSAPEEARLAEQTALDTEGVQSVINQLTMRVPAVPQGSPRSPGLLQGTTSPGTAQ